VTYDDPVPRNGRAALLAWGFTVPIGVLTFAYGFVSAYMLNDQIDSQDHLQFLTPVAAGALLSTALTAALLRRDRGGEHALLAALAWCCGTTAVAAAVVIALVT
jgi:zinc transporter ZupT